MKKMSKLVVLLLSVIAAPYLQAQTISSFPHNENFESFPLCGVNCNDVCTLPNGWVNVANDGMDWTVNEGPTPTANTGPDVDHNPGTAAGNYLYTETSNGCTNLTVALLTPPLDLTGLSNFSFDFWYHMYGNTVPVLHIDVSTNNGFSYTDDVVPPLSLNLNLWQKSTVNLDAYIGSTIIIRLRGVTGNGATDMAVDDFTFYTIANDDAGISGTTAPVSPISPGVQNVTVVLNNFGLNTLTSADIGWNVNGTPQTVYNWTGSLAFGQSAPVTIGTYNFPAGNTQLEVWTTNPNNTTDGVSANDTFATSFCTALNGAYTVGGASPDFNDLQAAVQTLYTCGVSGPVVFNMAAGLAPDTAQWVLTPVTGASAINTITINGNGNTLTANPTTDDRYVVKLDGAKHFILDDFNIITTNATYGWGVFLTNRADSNTIRNCTINVSAVTNTGTSNSTGIVVSGSSTSVTTAGNNASRLVVQGNTIIGGYNGIRITGAQLTKSFNNIIEGNTIRDFYTNGVSIADNDNTLISGNDISRGSRVTVGTFTGIYFDVRNQRTLAEKNKIHDTHGAASSLTGAAYGVYSNACDAFAGAENRVINNLIYDFNGNGIIYAIFNSSSDGVYYYHNTISLDDQNSSGGITRGFYQTSVAANIQFKNNIISVTRAGTGAKYCLYFSTTTSSIISDYNAFYRDTTSFIGFYSVDYKNLAQWKTTANGGVFDNNSVYGNPMFVNPVNNLNVTNGLLNGIGDSLGVATDIAGTTRDASNPDPGAYEFSPLTADVYISWVSPVSPTIPGNKIITVKITNSASSLQNITELNLSYTDGIIAPVTESFSSLNIAPGANLNISFATPYDLLQYTTLTAYINTANGVPDAFQSNDTTRQVLCPSLTGNYTINNTLAAGGNNFTSFTEAINALTFCGIIGPVTFDVATGTGPYTEQLTIPLISGSSAINTVTFNGNGNILQFAPVSANRHIIKLTGARYIIFNNLEIKGTSAAYGWAVHLINAADHNTFNNCTIDLTAVISNNAADYAGIVATNSSTSVTSNANNTNYLTVSNCTIIGGGYGIRLNGTVSPKARGNSITGNTIRDFHSYGVYLTHADSCEVIGNDISRANKTTVGPFYGIYITTGVENTLIERNAIHNTHDSATNPTELAYAIYFTGADAQLGKANYVVNNIIYKINGNGPVYGIYNNSSDHAKYYHNTIALDDSTALTTDETRGFYQTTTASGVEFKNNIVTVKRGGTGDKHAIYLATTTSSIESDHNVLLMDAAGGVANYLGHYGAADYTTLVQWKTVNLGEFDQNSQDVDPQYTDGGNGDLTPLNFAINNLGTAVGVTTDYILRPRNATFPDPGAFEITPVGLDAAIAWVAPVTPINAGVHTVTVNISNTQTLPITSLVLSYSNGTNEVTEKFTGLSIAGGANQNISFTTPYVLSGLATLRAYIDSVNQDLDQSQLNDTTATVVLCVTMNGNYTINKNLASSTTNFTSFADAVARLSNCGISGPVTIEVTPGTGPYNEQFVLPHIFGSSAVNTITIDGNNELLSFAPSVDDRYHIRLNGTKHLTLKDLRITCTGTIYGYGIHFLAQADSNTVTGCRIDLSAVTSTASDNSAGILFSGGLNTTGTDGNNGNYNMITNTEVIGGYYGIRVNGIPGTPVIENHFVNNIVRDFYTYGFYFANSERSDVTGNDINRATRVTVGTFYGINLASGNQSILMERNRIHNTHDNASSLTGQAYPIYFSSCDATPGNENKVINNLIYNINSNGTVYAIYNSSSDGVFYYHNSISLDNQNTSGGTTRGFYQTSQASNIDFSNNIVSIKRSGTGSKHCIYLGTAASAIIADYNLYYTDTTVNFVGSLSGADYPGLAFWKTANSGAYDQNSTFDDPVFGSIISGNLTPLNSNVNDKGAPVGVTTDFNQNPRSLTTPDVGAYEFTPVLEDATVVAVLNPAENACGSSAVAIDAVITNFGINTLSGVMVTANVSGALTGIFTGNSGTITNTESDTVSLGTLSLPQGGTITLTVFTSAVNDGAPFNDTLVVTRTISPPTPTPSPLPYQDTVCSGASTSIAIIPSPNISYYWYDTASGGTPLKAGPIFISPALTQNTTYYLEASTDVRHRVGPVDNNFGSSTNFTQVGARGLLFDVLTLITLDSVSVFPNDTGTVYVELTDVSNNTIYQITSAHVSTSGVKVTIPVGFTITPGSYRLDANGSTTGGLFYNSTGAAYPYKVNDVISITGNTFDQDSYYFFYDWKITEKGCPSNRVALPVAVNLTDTAASATFNYVVSGLDVTFTPDDNNPNNDYDWDFGDGVTGTIGSIAHQYNQDGTYNACLTISNSCSQDTECDLITVCGALISGFTYNTNGLTAQFTYNGVGLPATYDWDFGDGFSSTSGAPSHTYTTAGTYNVELIVENACNGLDTVVLPVTVCAAVNADFTLEQVTVGGLEFNFTDASSGIVASYSWNFGDGNTSANQNPSHTYTQHDNYTVTLTVTNACGGSHTTTKPLNTCSASDVEFTASVGGDGQTVTITNSSTGTDLTYSWNFGDGTSSTDEAPTHIYLATGNYTITLTVTNACGQSDVGSGQVSISVGVLQVNADFEIAVMPNPNDGRFTIRYELPHGSEVNLRMFNFLGETVYLRNENLLQGGQTQQLDVSHLAKGIYFLEVKTEKGVGMVKVAVK